jgi:hypothetical protein
MESLLNRIATVFTQQVGFLPIEFVFGTMTALTQDKGLAFFDPGYRNEKYLKIMIDTHFIGLM